VEEALLREVRRAVLQALEERRSLVAFSRAEALELDRLARQYEVEALERVRGALQHLPPKGLAVGLRNLLERMDEQLRALEAQASIAESSRRLQRDDITWRTFEDVAALLGIEA